MTLTEHSGTGSHQEEQIVKMGSSDSRPNRECYHEEKPTVRLIKEFQSPTLGPDLCLLGIHNSRPHMAAGSGAARKGRLEQCRFWLRQDGLENFDGHYHSGKAVIDLMVRSQGR